MNGINIEPIAYLRCDLPDKFGVPRQGGIVKELNGTVEFTNKYRNVDFIRGIEQYSHLWLIWGFSENFGAECKPTVRPPRLGGNTRLGVFATRSPFRPNPLGLSCVKLLEVKQTENGSVLIVSGIDMTDMTPIYDIKPYLPYVDSIPGASGGFSEEHKEYRLNVIFPNELLSRIPSDKQSTVCDILSGDPRPAYQHDPERIYGLKYAEFDIKFKVDKTDLTVVDVDIYK